MDITPRHASTYALVLLFILILSTLSSATLLYPRSSLRSYNNQKWRSSGLFVSSLDVWRLRHNRNMNDVYVLQNTKPLFPFNGTCDDEMYVNNGGAGEISTGCDQPPSTPPGPNNWAGTTQGCCNTVMTVELPQEVTSLLTGRTHQVVQFLTSSQLIHTGACEQEQAMCILNGVCTTVYRVQWLLVRPAFRPTGDDDDDELELDDDDDVAGGNSFVPTMVPNHCQCIFT